MKLFPQLLSLLKKSSHVSKGKLDIDIPFKTMINSYLYVEIDGGNKNIIFEQIEKIFEIIRI